MDKLIESNNLYVISRTIRSFDVNDIITLSMTSKKVRDILNQIFSPNFYSRDIKYYDLIKEQLEIPESPINRYYIAKQFEYIIPCKEMDICWMENSNYYEYLKTKESIFGVIAHLKHVCWLHNNSKFKDVPLDIYNVYCKIKIDRYHSIPKLDGEVKILDPNNNNEVVEVFKFKHPSSTFKTGYWYLLKLGTIKPLSISNQNFDFQVALFHTNNQWKSGLDVDYFTIVPESNGTPEMLIPKGNWPTNIVDSITDNQRNYSYESYSDEDESDSITDNQSNYSYESYSDEDESEDYGEIEGDDL